MVTDEACVYGCKWSDLRIGAENRLLGRSFKGGLLASAYGMRFIVSKKERFGPVVLFWLLCPFDRFLCFATYPSFKLPIPHAEKEPD